MTSDIDLRLGRWEDVLGDVECDALVVDAPYLERTHAGHDAVAAQANVGESRNNRVRFERGFKPICRKLNYGAWTSEDVHAFVSSWSPRTRGWFVSITDYECTSYWIEALALAGRYVFSPLAFVAPGSTVRFLGDGPAQWACWIVVARPRSSAFVKWGALPGAYVVPRGHNSQKGDAIVGGKPLWLMQSLVRDYSRPGDLVCDPCAGGGTTLLAAAIEARRAVGSEMDPAHFEIAQKRLGHGYTPTLFTETEVAR